MPHKAKLIDKVQSMLKKILLALLFIFLLILLLLGCILLFANTGPGRSFISSRATVALDREVRYTGNLHVTDLFPFTLRLSGLDVANMQGGRAGKMLELGTAEVAISGTQLLTGDMVFPRILLADSTVHLERTATAANWQFGEPEDKDEEMDDGPEIRRLDLQNAVVTYYDQTQKIDIRLTGRTEGEQVVAKGEGTYLGQPFKLDMTAGALLEVRRDAPYPLDLTLAVGHTLLHATGTVQNPTDFEALDAMLRLKGADAAELFPLMGIALPPTPPYDVKGKLRYDDGVWSFNEFSGHMGKSDLSGSVKWDKSQDRPKLTAEFVSQKLDLVDLGPLIGLAPAEPESEEQERYAQQREESPYAIPDVPLDISRLKAMDANVTFRGQQVISPNLPLDDFLLKVTLDNSLLHIDPVQFGTADGDVTAHFTVNAREEPAQIESDFRFSRLSLARLTEGVESALPMTQESEGLIGGTAKLSGQGTSLKQMLSTANGNIGVGMEGGLISNLLLEIIGLDIAQGIGFLLSGDEVVPIRCVIGDFAVENGIMQARALVIDTKDTNVQGGGTINLQTEAMKLHLNPLPKDATIATLRTPLRVEGTLRQPDFVLEKGGLLAKGAGVAGLSVLLTPLAGWLALMETGLGKDSNCTALIQQMQGNLGETPETDEVPVNPTTPGDESRQDATE